MKKYRERFRDVVPEERGEEVEEITDEAATAAVSQMP